MTSAGALYDNTVAGYSYPRWTRRRQPRRRGPLRGARRARAPRRRQRRARVRAVGGSLHRPALALLLVASLLRAVGDPAGAAVRLQLDEDTHFVPRAIALLRARPEPAATSSTRRATPTCCTSSSRCWFGGGDAVSARLRDRPDRGLRARARRRPRCSATLAVWLLYLAGARFFDRRVGLLAAALLRGRVPAGLLRHLALNDVPTLAPVTLALYGTAGVLRRGGMRDDALAGARRRARAPATKYTGGIALLPLLTAFVVRRARAARCRCARRPALRARAARSALVAFLSRTRTRCSTSSRFHAGVTRQAPLARGEELAKLGLTHGNGVLYYLWTLTWGLGWVPALAALGGAILLSSAARSRWRSCCCRRRSSTSSSWATQERYFGRWLLPILPIVALLAAYGAVALVALARALAGGCRAGGRRARGRGAAAAQGLVAVHPRRPRARRARTPATWRASLAARARARRVARS